MKNKTKIIPKLRFSEFDNDGEWASKSFGEYLDESRIKGSKGDVSKKITVKLWGKGVFRKEETIKGSKNTQYYIRKKGQFIYSKLDFLNQAFGIIPDRLDGFESTVDLPCFDFKKGINQIFLLKYVMRQNFYKKMGEIADGGRKAKRIQVDTFLKFPIIIPSLPEQQKIADCLVFLDELIKIHTDKLEAIKYYKKGLMQQLFHADGERIPKLRFPEFDDDGEWEEKKLIGFTDRGNKWSFIGGPFGSNLKASDFTNSGIRVIQLQNIGDGEFKNDCKIFTSIEKADELLSCNIFPGDIIIAKMGDPVARACIIPNHHSRYVMCSDGIRFVVNENKYSKYFVYSLINSLQFRKLADNSSSGSTRKRIALSVLKNLPVVIPKLGEQQKIADCLSSLDDMIKDQKKKVAELKNHKKGLMQQLFPIVE